MGVVREGGDVIRGKSSRLIEWLILGLIFFLAIPLSGVLRDRLHLPGFLAIGLSMIFLIGLALFFREQIMNMDRVFISIISIRFLKEFLFMVLLLYGLVIITFGTLYYLIALIIGNNLSYFSWLYFSIITLTTVGYGDVTPINVAMKLLVSLESFIGYISPSLIFTVGLGLILKENKI